MFEKKFIEKNGDTSIFIYIPNAIDRKKIKNIKKILDSKMFRKGETSWKKPINREQLWYQRENKYFCNSWSQRYDRWVSNQYEDWLIELENDIANILKEIKLQNISINIPEINSCLINKYRNHLDSIKPHRDTQLSFGNNPTIIGLSIGSTRNIKIKKLIYDETKPDTIVYDNKNSNLNFEQALEEGSLFIMAGCSQKYFSHEIPKENLEKKERYSLTFREFIN